jgi:hypothetical protein
MTHHTYNDPTLTNIQFLEAVRRDPTVPITERIKAVEVLLEIRGPEPSRKPSLIPMGDKDVTLTIRVGTIFPGKPDTVELYDDLLRIKRCWELTQQTGKVISPDLETAEVEGHA